MESGQQVHCNVIGRLHCQIVYAFAACMPGGLADDAHKGDVETHKATSTWTLGSGVNHQQVGNVWSRETDIVSLSMSGDLNVFDSRAGEKPARVVNASPSN